MGAMLSLLLVLIWTRRVKPLLMCSHLRNTKSEQNRTKADETGVIWASATKFGRDLAMKHQDEIRRRHPDAKKAVTGPRAVGMALQSEFANFFLGMNKGASCAEEPKINTRSGPS